MLPKKVLTCEMSLVDANMYYVLPLPLLLLLLLLLYKHSESMATGKDIMKLFLKSFYSIFAKLAQYLLRVLSKLYYCSAPLYFRHSFGESARSRCIVAMSCFRVPASRSVKMMSTIACRTGRTYVCDEVLQVHPTKAEYKVYRAQ